MRLLPLDSADLIAVVARWLAAPENFQWIDPGIGHQQVTPALVKIMAQRDPNEIRVFTANDNETPIGVVGFSNVDRHFKTATLWVVLGNKSYGRQLYSNRALSKLLTHGFHKMGLGAINTWIVEHNRSVAIAKRLNFQYVGRQRHCHYIDGQPYDRLWFDILPHEHLEHHND